MLNSGRNMSTPGWCTFALLGGVLAVAVGALASATPRDKSKATTPVLAIDNSAAATRIGQTTAVADNLKSANSKKNSPASLSSAQLSLTTVQDPSGTRTAMGGGVDWFEDFESYGDDNCAIPFPWEPWQLDPGAIGCVRQNEWLSFNHSIEIVGPSDMVRVTTGYTSGLWNYCAWQLIDENFSGETFFIILNTYPPGGAPPLNWSTQMTFDTGTGLVSDFNDPAASVPLIVGEWVEVCVQIDLFADTQKWFYNNVQFQDTDWTTHVGGAGILEIQALDLWGNFAGLVYYDDISLTQKEGVPFCGNDSCDLGEDQCNCPADCLDPAFCGDGVCCAEAGETCENCEVDCGPCAECGNGKVEEGEDCDPPFVELCPDGVELCDENCQCPGGPGPDACEDRIEIFDGPTLIDTTEATTDGLPTSGLGDCDDFDPFDPQIYNDTWYNYNATCTGQLSVSTCNIVNYDSKIAIYKDCDTALCPRGGDEIGCNDDGPGCAGFSSFAEADVLEGNCYKIRIGGFSAADSGTGTVIINCGPPTGGCCDAGNNCKGDTLEVDCEGTWFPGTSCTGEGGLPVTNCCPECGGCCVDGECIGDTLEENCEGNFTPGSSCTGEDGLPIPICNTGCSWDNGPPLDDAGAPASQWDPVYPFAAGAADDFILKDAGDNTCRITNVTAWTAHFGPNAASPAAYDGINLTIYADAVDIKGPGGQPEADGTHSGAVIHTEFIPQGAFVATEEFPTCTDEYWRIDMPVNFELPKNTKMWLEVAPVFSFADFGQSAFQLSQNSTGHPAQQIFELLELPWTEISGNDNACPPDTPPLDTRRDLAFIITGEKSCNLNGTCDPGENSCNCAEDCGACEGTCISGECCGDGVVNGNEECDFGSCGTCITDGPVAGPDGETGASDLGWVLGNWGPFIDNPQCQDGDGNFVGCPADLVCLDDLDPIPGNEDIGAEELSKILGSWGCCCDNPDPNCTFPPGCENFGGGENQCEEADCDDSCQCAGRGACCGVKGDPGACNENRTVEECAAEGGNYAGDDTTCEDCPPEACIGAGGSCFEVHANPGCANEECCAIVCNLDDFCCNVTWTNICVAIAEENCPPPTCGDGICEGDEDECNCGPPDGDCEGKCDDLLACPSGSCFSQETALAGEGAAGVVGATSDAGPGFLVYENWTGVATPITDLHWWGIYVDFPLLVECNKDHDFTVTFWADAAGSPGAMVAGPYTITPVKTDSGQDVGTGIGPLSVWRFDVDALPDAIDLGAGWVSIQGLVDPANVECDWLWSTAPPGDGMGWQDVAATDYDLALCLTCE